MWNNTRLMLTKFGQMVIERTQFRQLRSKQQERQLQLCPTNISVGAVAMCGQAFYPPSIRPLVEVNIELTSDTHPILALEDSPMHAVGARRLALAVVLLALGGLHPALHTAAALLRHVALLRADGLPILALHDVVVLGNDLGAFAPRRAVNGSTGSGRASAGSPFGLPPRRRRSRLCV